MNFSDFQGSATILHLRHKIVNLLGFRAIFFDRGLGGLDLIGKAAVLKTAGP